ncbi:ABC transporter ATP-binding protein [Micromonospora schwarzwaldensis]|uniref:ABC transporter ATP-binding protein n=1 Tax=Micromonospora sp. DSM 45708 TaxID=3111767 RepID=UPI0031DA8F29
MRRAAVDPEALGGLPRGGREAVSAEHPPHARAVVARGLTKRYADRTAVRRIDLGIGLGEVYGLLGRNGAGKSTTMRMIGCVSKPSAGDLSVLGLDALVHGPEIRARLGVVPQQDTLDSELTVRENVVMFARYFGIPRRVARQRADQMLEFMNLADRPDARTGDLSGGMRRRLSIARALVNEPSMILLDEPTSGLDPQSRHLLWERLYQLKRDGVTMLLTTHYMDEAEQLCDRIGIIDDGRIVIEGVPADLVRRFAAREVVELRFDPSRPVPPAALAELGGRVRRRADKILVFTDDADEAVRSILGMSLGSASMLVRRSNLEDVFLALTTDDAAGP